MYLELNTNTLPELRVHDAPLSFLGETQGQQAQHDRYFRRALFAPKEQYSNPSVRSGTPSYTLTNVCTVYKSDVGHTI